MKMNCEAPCWSRPAENEHRNSFELRHACFDGSQDMMKSEVGSIIQEVGSIIQEVGS